MLVIRALQACTLYIPFLMLFLSIRQAVDGLLGSLWTMVFLSYSYTRLHAVFYDWWTTQFQIGDDGVCISTGLYHKKEVSIRWSDLTSIQVTRSLLHRILSCSQVRIGVGSTTKQFVILHAVSEVLAADLVHHLDSGTLPRRTTDDAVSLAMRNAVSAPTSTNSPPRTRPMPQRPSVSDCSIYAIRFRDYLLISLTYGQFVLLIPMVVSAYSELSRWFELPALDLFSLNRLWLSLSPWTIVVMISSTAALAIAFGWAVAWLKYRGFEVRVREGRIHIAGGLISHEIRQVVQDKVTGLRVEQNPIMRVMGYGKLSLVSRQPGRKVGTNVVFPVLKLRRLEKGIDEFFPEYGGTLSFRPPPRKKLAILVMGIGTVSLTSSWMIARTLLPNPDIAIATVCVIGLMFVFVSNRLWGVIRVDPAKATVQVTRGFLWVKRYNLSMASVHVLMHSQSPLGRMLCVSRITLVIFDGRRVRLRVMGHRRMLSRIGPAIVAAQASRRSTADSAPDSAVPEPARWDVRAIPTANHAR